MSSPAHVPVLLREVLDLLAPRPGMTVVDGTVGGGGHAEAILEALSPDGVLVAVDRDARALDAAKTRLARFGGRVRWVEGDYADLSRHLVKAGISAAHARENRPHFRMVMPNGGLITFCHFLGLVRSDAEIRKKFGNTG